MTEDTTAGRRRSYGTGSIQDLGAGRYRLRVFTGTDPVTGHPRQVSRRVAARNRTEAQRLLDDLRREVGADDGAEDGPGQGPGPGGSVGALLDEWLAHIEARGRSPKTLHEARRIIERVLRPELGGLAAAGVTPRDIDELYRRLASGEGRSRPLSAASIRRYHAVLSAAFNQAVRWEWIPSNPAARAEPPPLPQRAVVIPTADEVQALLSTARRRDPKWAMLLTLAVGTGARRGELCGLRWVDMDDGVLHIRRSIYRAGPARGEKATKGGRERVVALSPVLVDLLEDWRSVCAEEARAIGITPVPDAFIVSPYPDGARPVNPDSFTSFVTRLCAVPNEDNPGGLDMPHVHLHSLRHFAATELIGSGVNPRDAADLLGHADPALTLRVYAHATTDRQRLAAAALGEAVRSALPVTGSSDP